VLARRLLSLMLESPIKLMLDVPVSFQLYIGNKTKDMNEMNILFRAYKFYCVDEG